VSAPCEIPTGSRHALRLGRRGDSSTATVVAADIGPLAPLQSTTPRNHVSVIARPSRRGSTLSRHHRHHATQPTSRRRTSSAAWLRYHSHPDPRGVVFRRPPAHAAADDSRFVAGTRPRGRGAPSRHSNQRRSIRLFRREPPIRRAMPQRLERRGRFFYGEYRRHRRRGPSPALARLPRPAAQQGLRHRRALRRVSAIYSSPLDARWRPFDLFRVAAASTRVPRCCPVRLAFHAAAPFDSRSTLLPRSTRVPRCCPVRLAFPRLSRTRAHAGPHGREYRNRGRFAPSRSPRPIPSRPRDGGTPALGGRPRSQAGGRERGTWRDVFAWGQPRAWPSVLGTLILDG
jgi:hypothetical protein